MRWITLTIIILGLCGAASARPERTIFKCVGPGDKVSYQSAPCPNDTQALTNETPNQPVAPIPTGNLDFGDQQGPGPDDVLVVAGSGSGFLVHPEGYILTNDHVAGTSTRVSVLLSDGRKYLAKVVRLDKDRDLALLKIEANDLPHLALADSSVVGHLDPVVVIGYPLANILGSEVSTSKGDITAIRQGPVGQRIFQTNATINPGNSGGPVLGDTGEVIGLVFAKLGNEENGTMSEGINFVIPAEAAFDLMTEVPGWTPPRGAQGKAHYDQREVFHRCRDAAVLVHNLTLATREGVLAPDFLQPLTELGGIWELRLAVNGLASEVRVEPRGDLRLDIRGDARIEGTYEQLAGYLVRLSHTEGMADQLWKIRSSEQMAIEEGPWHNATLTRLAALPESELAPQLLAEAVAAVEDPGNGKAQASDAVAAGLDPVEGVHATGAQTVGAAGSSPFGIGWWQRLDNGYLIGAAALVATLSLLAWLASRGPRRSARSSAKTSRVRAQSPDPRVAASSSTRP